MDLRNRWVQRKVVIRDFPRSDGRTTSNQNAKKKSEEMRIRRFNFFTAKKKRKSERGRTIF